MSDLTDQEILALAKENQNEVYVLDDVPYYTTTRKNPRRSLADIRKIVKQDKRIEELKQERDEYHAMVVYTVFIMENSQGVAGYHLNGELADWDSLFTPLYKELLAIRDLEQQAKGLTDYAKNNCSGIDAVWLIAAASKLREQAKQLKGGE